MLCPFKAIQQEGIFINTATGPRILQTSPVVTFEDKQSQLKTPICAPSLFFHLPMAYKIF
jgi:hypothetical protein